MDLFEDPDKDKCQYEHNPQKETQTALKVQFVISLGLGLSAFLAFCVSSHDTLHPIRCHPSY